MLCAASILILVSSAYGAEPSEEKPEATRAPPSPLHLIEYKNDHYLQPPIPAGDGGHMIRIPLQAPGHITRATVTRKEGPGCAWTYECPDGAQCPSPYRYPFHYEGTRAWWQAWSNSGDNCAVHFAVHFRQGNFSQGDQ